MIMVCGETNHRYVIYLCVKSKYFPPEKVGTWNFLFRSKNISFVMKILKGYFCQRFLKKLRLDSVIENKKASTKFRKFTTFL